MNFKPRLEELERRDCPAPTISVTSLTETAGHQVLVQGVVTDTNPQLDTVKISSPVNSNAGTTWPAANGSYFVVANVGGNGTLSAKATNMAMQDSNVVTVTLVSEQPELQALDAATNNGLTWTISGRVHDEYPQGLTVYLTGPAFSNTGTAPVTATCDANGDFSVSVTFAANPMGNAVYFNVSDWWGNSAAQDVLFI